MQSCIHICGCGGFLNMRAPLRFILGEGALISTGSIFSAEKLMNTVLKKHLCNLLSVTSKHSFHLMHICFQYQLHLRTQQQLTLFSHII